jgi:hypothetical protein
MAYAMVLASGCVITGQGIMQSSVVIEHACIPEDQSIMICIAMGYPENDFISNTVKSVREDNKNFVRYVGLQAVRRGSGRGRTITVSIGPSLSYRALELR